MSKSVKCVQALDKMFAHIRLECRVKIGLYLRICQVDDNCSLNVHVLLPKTIANFLAAESYCVRRWRSFIFYWENNNNGKWKHSACFRWSYSRQVDFQEKTIPFLPILEKQCFQSGILYIPFANFTCSSAFQASRQSQQRLISTELFYYFHFMMYFELYHSRF